MKKNITLLSCFLLLISLWFSCRNFTVFVMRSAVSIIQNHDAAVDRYGFQVSDGLDREDPALFHQTLEETAAAYGFDIAKLVFTAEEGSGRPLTQVFLSAGMQYAENRIYLVSGQADLSTDTIYSTASEEGESRIAAVFPDEVLNVAPIRLDDENGGMYTLFISSLEDSTAQRFADFQTAILTQYPSITYATLDYRNMAYSGDRTKAEEFRDMLKKDLPKAEIVTCLLTILLCTRMFALRKHIGVMKAEGYTSYGIYRLLYLIPYMKTCFIVMVLWTIISFVLYIHSQNTFRLFLLITLCEYVLFCIVQLLVSLGLILMIYAFPVTSSEKGKTNLRELYYMALLVKLAAACYVLGQLVYTVPELHSYKVMRRHREAAEAVLENRYAFGNERASSYFSDIGTENYTALRDELIRENDYFSFGRDMLYENGEYLIPCYSVDLAYLEKEHLLDSGTNYARDVVIYTIEGQEYDIVNTVRFAKLKSFDSTRGSRVISLADRPGTYSPEELLWSDQTDGRVLVYVPEDDFLRGQIEGGNIYYEGSVKEAQKYIDDMFHRYGYESAFRLNSVLEIYRNYYHWYEDGYLRKAFRLIICGLLYFLVCRFLTDLDIENNRKRYYLSYVEGVMPYKVIEYIRKMSLPAAAAVVFSTLKNAGSVNAGILAQSILTVLVFEVLMYLWFSVRMRKDKKRFE